MTTLESALVVGSLLLILSVVASKLSAKLGVPALLLFLAIGMLAGSDGPGGIEFDNPRLAQHLGVVALAYILFDGGLETDWRTVRPVWAPALALSTLGVLASACLVGAFAAWVLDFPPLVGVLLGAIVSSTDAAAVFSVLRSRNVGLRARLKALLELEAGSNDPMAVFLTVGLTGLLTASAGSLLDLVPIFFRQMALGALLGLGLGEVAVRALNRLRLEYEGLYPVFTLATVALVYGVTTWLGGNGFLAVYLAGLVLGNRPLIHKASLLRFHDGLAWIVQIAMFLTLGLLVFPSRLPHIAGEGLLVSAFVILLARPLSVFLTLWWTRMDRREKAFVSWVGLRGAVPIILATFPLLAGVPQADTIFDLVFFIVLTSVLLQGTTISQVAARLGVAVPAPPTRLYPLQFVPAAPTDSELIEIVVPMRSPIAGKPIVELGLPKGALIVVVSRGDDWIVPTGNTVLEPGDALLVLANRKAVAEIRPILESS